MKKRFSSPGDAVVSYLALILVWVILLALVHLPVSHYQLAFALLSLGILWLFLCGPLRPGRRFSAWVFVVACASLLVLFAVSCLENSRKAADGQQAYFSGRNTLVLVPHQDDELLTLGGVLERFSTDGELTTAFVTNGDYDGKSTARLTEAIHAMAQCGVPEDHVVFLGYGDRWDSVYRHIYFAPDNRIVSSHCGETHTYGIDGKHEPFRSSDYTRANLLADITALITTLHPDTIYCIDYDAHDDHQATSLLFEEAMGSILAENAAYRPLVFKMFAYDTALNLSVPAGWVNIPSSNLYDNLPYVRGNSSFLWENRIRLPISVPSATRVPEWSLLRKAAAYYSSQTWYMQLRRVLRGDKVVWRRYTDGVQYGADWSVSSGDESKLHDFKLLDKENDFTYETTTPTEGTWIPAPDDRERSLRMQFSTPVTLQSVCLYDNPSLTDNILNAEIAFSDGTSLQTGPLPFSGAPGEIAFAPRKVEWVSVRILETQGSACGFTEVEAYSAPHPSDGAFLKLMDQSGNFVYHYDLNDSDEATLLLYEYNLSRTESVEQAYALETSGSITAEWRQDAVLVRCPPGKKGVLTLRGTEDDSIWDSVEILRLTDAERAAVDEHAEFLFVLRNFFSASHLHAQRLYYETMRDNFLQKFNRQDRSA